MFGYFSGISPASFAAASDWYIASCRPAFFLTRNSAPTTISAYSNRPTIRSTKFALAENVIARSVSNPEKSSRTGMSPTDSISTLYARIWLSSTASWTNGIWITLESGMKRTPPISLKIKYLFLDLL